MKATGIVRRIDDLGRVVIPKEIRRTQRIREGDPLEIFISADGEVIFKKYSPIGELSGMSAQCADVLAKNLNLPVLVCDRDHIIAAAGPGKKEHLEKRISAPLEEIMKERRTFRAVEGEEPLYPCEGCQRPIVSAAPIVVQGDVTGAVAVLAEESGAFLPEADARMTSLTAGFLAKQLEE